MCAASARASALRSIAALTASTASGTIGLNPTGTIRRYERLDINL
jgi:hypothetical protein